VVVAADGLRGRFLARTDSVTTIPGHSARLGAGAIVESPPDFFESGTIYMACGQGGYVGLVRLENGRLDVAAALDITEIRAGHGPGAPIARLLAEAGWPVPGDLERLNWHGTLPLAWRAKRIADNRVFGLGDAAEYFEPFTGEGIGRALTAGLAVAPIVERAANSWDDALQQEWTSVYRRCPGRGQFVCRLAAAVLRRPRMARSFIGVLSYAPALALPVVRYLDAPFSPTLTIG
jgi:flavin-dependent dehydrogenase